MSKIDRLHTEFPFAGSRMLRRLLAFPGLDASAASRDGNGSKARRRHVKTPMQRLGIEALYRRPRTSKPEPGHKIYPYLLAGLKITRPNQVWAMDITDIPMAKGFVYLAAVLDWFSRRVLAWRVSITMEASICVETLQDALAAHDTPETFNTDQGSQFTGAACIGVLAQNGIVISMDGKGASCPARLRHDAGQRVGRAAVAHGEIRGGVPARLRQRVGRPRLARPLPRLLKPPPAAFEP